MNPIINNHMGYIHQQEILGHMAESRNRKPIREHLADLSTALVRMGQKKVDDPIQCDCCLQSTLS